MPNSFFKNITTLALVFTGVGSVIALGAGSWLGACAVAIGVAWAFLNGFFLFQLVGIALTPKPQQQNKILLLSVLKFPVLYLAGFYILKYRLFPVAGILAGLTIFFAAILLGWLMFNLNIKRLVRNAS